jgi:hypothetical protein
MRFLGKGAPRGLIPTRNWKRTLKLLERLQTVAADHVNLCEIAEVSSTGGYNILLSALAHLIPPRFDLNLSVVRDFETEAG